MGALGCGGVVWNFVFGHWSGCRICISLSSSEYHRWDFPFSIARGQTRSTSHSLDCTLRMNFRHVRSGFRQSTASEHHRERLVGFAVGGSFVLQREGSKSRGPEVNTFTKGLGIWGGSFFDLWLGQLKIYCIICQEGVLHGWNTKVATSNTFNFGFLDVFFRKQSILPRWNCRQVYQLFLRRNDAMTSLIVTLNFFKLSP